MKKCTEDYELDVILDQELQEKLGLETSPWAAIFYSGLSENFEILKNYGQKGAALVGFVLQHFGASNFEIKEMDEFSKKDKADFVLFFDYLFSKSLDFRKFLDSEEDKILAPLKRRLDMELKT